MTPTDLRAFIEHQGWSERETARQLGCSRPAITRWLRGETRIPRYIELACERLNATVPAHARPE